MLPPLPPLPEPARTTVPSSSAESHLRGFRFKFYSQAQRTLPPLRTMARFDKLPFPSSCLEALTSRGRGNHVGEEVKARLRQEWGKLGEWRGSHPGDYGGLDL